MKSYFSIAIDGPAGAGKSTIAKKIAKQLAFIYIDTGAMYRAFALYCCRKGVKPTENQVKAWCSEVQITIEYQQGEQQVILNGENVTPFIRTAEIGRMASEISIYESVRKKLVDLQRALAQKNNVIMDGRDIGSYVLPEADLKIYLTASVEERAKRRWQELCHQGDKLSLACIEEEIRERDHRDMSRAFAPLKKSPDAVEIDTSFMAIDQVVDQIIEMFQAEKSGWL